jgi:two-component system sensor histidine kinase/response regulator
MTHDGLAIEGIDTDGALRRLGGKRERYEALLRKFADKQSGSAAAARAALAAGDHAAAERELHSLKGAAAALGAVALAEAASNAEAALKVGDGIDTALGSLESALGAVVAAIRTSLPVI